MSKQLVTKTDKSEQVELGTQHSKITWGPVVAIMGTVMIYFFAQIVAATIFAIYFESKQWGSYEINNWLQSNVWAQFWFVLTISATTFAATAWLVKLFKSKFSAIGIKRPKWSDVAWALSGYAVYFTILIIALNIVFALLPGLDNGQAQDIGFADTTRGAALLLVFISLVLLPAVVEEVLFRGFLFGGLRTKLTFIPAAVITSLMFGVVHLQFGGSDPLLWVAAIDTFILSMVMVFIRERSGSLWPTIQLHALKNGLAFLILFIF